MSLSDVEPLDHPQYEELSSITRSLHLRQAMASYGKQRLMSHKIVSKTVDLNAKVLWFAPTRPMNENNMYGNVSFTLDWKTALEQLGPYLYYVDQQENGEFIYSRVLLTNKEYEFLTLVDEDGHRMPMMKFARKHYAATACDGVKHVLEIGVEVDCNREKWLYLNCKIQANDHSSANTLLQPGGPYKSCTCHRFNYFKNDCPSPYKLQRTKKILEKRCPTMLRDRPAGISPSTHIIPKTNKRVEVVNDEGYDDDDEDGFEIYNFVPGYDDHKVVECSAAARRIVTTRVEVVELAPAVKPKTITPVTSPSSTTNVRTSGFTSAGLISSNATSHTHGSPSSSVGHSSGPISSSTASFMTYGSPPPSSVGHFRSSSPGYTSYRSDLYRTPSASVFASGTPQKSRDEELSTSEKVIVGALVAGGVALFAGLASLFGGGDDKKKRLEKGNSWWS